MPIRQPIICMLGHVDTGKTSLLDKIRGTAVQLREAGGLTQQIGASFFPLDTLVSITQRLVKDFKVSISIPGLLVVDTPGHEAFANLRRRGGSVADVAILVIDVMHGFENQTYESLEILKARKTPFIVAANKIDQIHGWRSVPDGPFTSSYVKQELLVREDLDGRIYNLIGTLSRLGFRSDRFDRVKDFTRDIAIVPVSAKTGEGIGEILAVLIGLTQQYMQSRLEVSEGPARGTILEVKEEMGLGTTINAVIYDGILGQEDTIVIGGREKPIVTNIRAILLPQPLDEIRDPRMRFNSIEKVHAAAGIKIAAPDLEDAIAGAPLLAVGGEMTLEKAFNEISSEINRLRISTDNVGVILKTDTLGSLEALTESLRAKEVPIRLADIGDVSRREVVEAISVRHEEPLYGAILAFNVRILPDAKRESSDQRVPIFENGIIYNLMDDYLKWVEDEREAKSRREFESLVQPAKMEVLEGFVFRRAKPAIFGVRVLAGVVFPNREIINVEGENLGRVTQIQESGQAVPKAEEGKEVAISMPKPVMGRHIKERDSLYVDVPEGHVKKLREKFSQRLSEGALDVLKKLVEIKRVKDPLWAI